MVHDVGALVLAGLFLFLALAALAVMASLRRPRDPLVAAFACFVGLFGTRLAARTQLAHDVVGPNFCQVTTDVITYLIPLPILFEQSRLENTLAEGAGLDVNAFSNSLLERLQEWRASGTFDDDVTFVAVDVR